MSIKPIFQDKREVGQHVKSSKVLFIWKFSMDESQYTIELYNSMLSGKKKILQNGQTIYQQSSFQGAFNFPFSIGRNSLSIVQHGDKFELRINNQSFDHLYNQKMTKSHFATDNFAQLNYGSAYGGGNNSYRGGSSSGNQGSKPSSSQREEDDEIRKAIELSKQTAKKEDERRKRQDNKRGGGSNEKKDDFDVGLGFEKFATGNIGSSRRANDIDDFDFGNMGSSRQKKEEESKQEDVFNFDVGNVQPREAPKSTVPQESTDLMDLLGGPSQPVQQNSQAQSNNAGMDFFGGGGANNPGAALGQAQGFPSQNQNAMFDFGGGSSNPTSSLGASADPSPSMNQGPVDPFSPSTQTNSTSSAPMEQQQQSDKPKFIPNPMFQAGMSSNPQQQYMMQMQMQQQQQQQMYYSQMNQGGNMGMGGMNSGFPQQQQQFNTQMNAGFGGGNPGMMSNMGGQPMQQQQQQNNPFDFGMGQQQQQQFQQPQPSPASNSTPFDF